MFMNSIILKTYSKLNAEIRALEIDECIRFLNSKLLISSRFIIRSEFSTSNIISKERGRKVETERI